MPIKSANVHDGHVLSIQSHTVAGYVGNKSATFPLQLLGFDVDSIHSVNYSNHTGYNIVRGTKLSSKEFDELFSGLKENSFLALYTHVLSGYAGHASVLESLPQAIEKIREASPALKYICDPVLGDHGNFYVPKGFVKVYAEKLIPLAYLVTPNQFECEVLTGINIRKDSDAIEAARALHRKGPKFVVISSLEVNEELIQVFASEKVVAGYQHHIINVEKLPGKYTGTGDLLSALLLGWMHKLPGEFLKAVMYSLGTMKGVIQRTLNDGSADLRVVQSLSDILSPPVLPFHVTTLSSSRIRGVIFDLDGTLTLPRLLDFAPLRERYGLKNHQDILHEVKKLSVFEQEEAFALIEEEEERARKGMKLQPNLHELFRNLKRENVKLAIATRNTFKTIEVFFEKVRLDMNLFDALLTRDFEYHKPDPRVATSICHERFELHPSEVLFVGDTLDDIECANKSGCISVLMKNCENEYAIPQCCFAISDLSELTSIVENSS